jgi:hypothetical protein
MRAGNRETLPVNSHTVKQVNVGHGGEAKKLITAKKELPKPQIKRKIK